MTLFDLKHIFQEPETAPTGNMSAASPVDGRPAKQLQSREHGELLDAIDRLRRESINAGLEISIPEIVVCGDQSSGKSSVLEAIAGVPFPLGPSTVTCFVTEVILRNTPEDSIVVRLSPADNSWDNSGQIQRIHDWQPECPILDVSGVTAVVEEAADFLKSLDSNRKFWRDRLQIELSGPSQPHLTLVDLPGLIQNDSEVTNKEMILKLTRERLSSARAVILAVVDAPNDLERHQIIQLLKDTKCQQRTMGILTKPDMLTEASDQEKIRIRMVQNGLNELGLGWHVVRNLPHECRVRSAAVRNAEETQFFQKRAWSQVSESLLGVDSLRNKLSQALLVRIKQDLPELIEDMERLRVRNMERLERLGDARETDEEKRKYLATLLWKLHRMVDDELYGTNDSSSDTHSIDGAQVPVLREAINAALDKFARSMLDMGQTFRIIDDYKSPGRFERLSTSTPILFQGKMPSGYAMNYTVDLPRYCCALVQHTNSTRGTGLRGMNTTAVTRDIFRQQSRPWKSIVLQCTETCQAAVHAFFTRICKQTADSYTADKLLSCLITPALLDTFTAANEKVQELLWPYTHCHPIITDTRFHATAKSNPPAEPADAKAKTEVEPVKGWAEKVEGQFWVGSEHKAAAESMDVADRYYKIAMHTFMENVGTLAIERCLLSGLPDIVSHLNVERFNVEEIAAIATERLTDQEKRANYQAQLKVLEKALRVCRMYNACRTPTHMPSLARSEGLLVHNSQAKDVSHTSAASPAIQVVSRSKTPQPRSVLAQTTSTKLSGGNTESFSFVVPPNPQSTPLPTSNLFGGAANSGSSFTPTKPQLAPQASSATGGFGSTPNNMNVFGQTVQNKSPSSGFTGPFAASSTSKPHNANGSADPPTGASKDTGKEKFVPFHMGEEWYDGNRAQGHGQSVCFEGDLSQEVGLGRTVQV